MRVLLVGPDLEENLSIRYLSAALKEAGHEAFIAAFDTRADLERVRTAAAAADLVGLSMCYQVRAPEFLELAAALERDRPERPIVAGGHFASCAAKELLADYPALDVVVIHEGERTLAELASLPRLDAEHLAGVRGIVYRGSDGIVSTPPRPIETDLDALPWADRTGPGRLVAGVPSAYLMGSRGCVSDCDYCAITTLHRLAPGKKFRQRDPEKIVDEMAWLYHERGVRQFIFHDDNFLVPHVEKNLQRIEAIDRAMRRRGLRHVGLVLKCRPADVERQAFLRLREMGLLRVFLGIESGSPEGLVSIGRRQTVGDAERALDLCKDLEISTQYTIITFHPEATPSTMLADLAFVRRHLGHPLSFCRAEAYTGTPLEQRMLDAGRARGSYMARTYAYTDPIVPLIWSAGRELLDSRLWSQANLLGQIIRLDHLVTVYRHFYDGRDVDALVSDFQAFEVEANRDSVDLLDGLIRACVEHPDASSAALQARLRELGEREKATTATLVRRACDFRETLHAQSYAKMGLGRPQQRAPAAPTSLLGRLPRHVAAAAIMISVANCDAGVNETAPPPMDSGVRNEGGVSEMPPPPMDGSADAARDGGRQDAQLVVDSGVIEAPPPPMDSGATDDAGVIEAPPPPMDDGGVIEAPPPALGDAG